MVLDPEEEAYQRKLEAAHAKRHIAIVFVVVAALVIAGFAFKDSLGRMMQHGPMYYKDRAETFKTEVQSVDVAAIRKWTATLPVEYTNWVVFPPELRKDFPLKDYALNWDGKMLSVYQGNGFGHYGLRIPPAGEPVPESTPREYRIPFKEGAYVFHEIQ